MNEVISGFSHCALSLAARCIVIGPVCVCGSVTTITRSCAHRSSPNWVCRWSDHLQLIKFLAVLRPREGGLRRVENVWLRLATASGQCLRLSERFFHSVLLLTSFHGLGLHSSGGPWCKGVHPGARGPGGLDPLKICRRDRSLFWPPEMSHSFIQNCCWITGQSFALSRMKDSCQKWKVKRFFAAPTLCQ